MSAVQSQGLWLSTDATEIFSHTTSVCINKQWLVPSLYYSVHSSATIIQTVCSLHVHEYAISPQTGDSMVFREKFMHGQQCSLIT